jgi:anti-anti-sigma factor
MRLTLENVSNESFKVEAEVKGGESSCAILRFEGPLTNRDSRVLGQLLRQLNRKPVETIILDLTSVTQIDSASLAAFLMFAKERESLRYALACALVLKGAVVLEKIKTLGIAPLFEIFGSMQEAEYNLGLAGGSEEGEEHDAAGLNIKARVKLITSSPRAAILTLSGYIQEKEAQYLSWLLRQVGRRGARHVILDLSGISYANSSALGVLVSTARIWSEAYGECCVALAGANMSLMRTLDLLGVQKHFVISSTVKKARRILRGDMLSEAPRGAKKLPHPSGRL